MVVDRWQSVHRGPRTAQRAGLDTMQKRTASARRAPALVSAKSLIEPLEERLVLSAAVMGAAIDGVHPRIAGTGGAHMGRHHFGHHHLGRHHVAGTSATGSTLT